MMHLRVKEWHKSLATARSQEEVKKYPFLDLSKRESSMTPTNTSVSGFSPPEQWESSFCCFDQTICDLRHLAKQRQETHMGTDERCVPVFFLWIPGSGWISRNCENLVVALRGPQPRTNGLAEWKARNNPGREFLNSPTPELLLFCCVH